MQLVLGQATGRLGSRSGRRPQLLGEGETLGLLDHDCIRDLVSGCREVAPRIGPHFLVRLKRQLQAGETVPVSALAQKRDGKTPAVPPPKPGDLLVGPAKHVFHPHGVYPHVPVPQRAFPIRRLQTLQARTLRQRIAPMGAREERLGANEALFREVNERVAEVAERFVADESHNLINFSCECGDKACAEQIPMTAGDYEAVRADATHFAVVPGHEVPDIERVIARHSNYFVVEKQDPDAEEVARDTDPRT
jgi:hypothetical protein